ncbi:site-2 protease family protein [Beggiatoa alba]|nr:site-2 protease family protein [Beggiatoa alba]
MFDPDLSTGQLILISIIPVLYAIVLHEVAHGWAAYKLGDRTALMLGRLSINPVKHVDPIGTILVPTLLILTAGFAFGWAKPVPIDWRNLKNPKRDTAIVAIAGPLANLIMALTWAILASLATILPENMALFSQPLLNMAGVGVIFNVLLMIFNLIPIPPTDGGRIAVSLLPVNLSHLLNKIEPFGLIIILILLFSGLFGQFLLPATLHVSYFIFSIVGL